MDDQEMNQASVICLAGQGDTMEEAADIAEQKMNGFLGDTRGLPRLVVNVSAQSFHVNHKFHHIITVLYRF